MTIIGMISLLALMLIEGRGGRVNPKSTIFVVAIVILSFLIQYTADPRQLQQYSVASAILFFLPSNILIIEASHYTTIFFLPLFVYGGVLGLLLSFLLSNGHHDTEKPNDDVLLEFALKGFFVVLIGPALLTLPIAFIIYLLLAAPIPFFPFYGEGTSGSILVVSVILSMYICARLIANWDRFNLKSITNAKGSTIVAFLVEFIGAYACITAAFSLMGGLLTDGTPMPLILPLDYILLTILVTIPFSLFIVRDRLFPQSIFSQTNHVLDYDSKG